MRFEILFLLAKQYRLPSHLIPELLKQGQRFYSKNLVLISQLQNQENFSRFAFIVSRKVDKRAVKRNKMKRQLSCWVQNKIDKFKKGYNLILLIKKGQLINSFSQISDELIMLFEKVKILGEK